MLQLHLRPFDELAEKHGMEKISTIGDALPWSPAG